ncbi:UNVERIFIED_CONTAM: Fasciclin-like arabinogalactan protein 16 [Sesamum radiatum]|uniref:Fasciclin-like arabinogalactan protein 16 n=1 Tax=Sesamum radiatum TaxID=300843 RepID=A0AAW2JXX2_SESRA
MPTSSPHLPLLLLLLLSAAAPIRATLPEKPAPISSSSILIALLDSQDYTELSELVEKALLLHTLEEALTKHNLTIFAQKNDALERHLDRNSSASSSNPATSSPPDSFSPFCPVSSITETGLH